MEVQTGLHARNDDAQTKGPNGRSSDVELTQVVEIGVFVSQRDSGRISLGITFYKPCMTAMGVQPGDFMHVGGSLKNGLMIRKQRAVIDADCHKVFKANAWGRIEVGDRIGDIILPADLRTPKKTARVECGVSGGFLHTPPLDAILRNQPPPAKRSGKRAKQPAKPARKTGDVIGDICDAIDLVNSYAGEDPAIRLSVAESGRRLSMTYIYHGPEASE